MQFTERAPVSVALVYQSQVLHQHLRAALDEVGAHVVYETATSGFDAGALAGSGANVIVINLDPAIDEEIEQIEELLVDDSRKVIFNDGEVTSKLGGWDLARWARHLAAKITGDTELLPARPAGAEAVPVRDMPQHALDSTFKPASLQPPVVTGEAEDRASREISAALSSFTADAFDAPATASAAPARNELEAALQDFGFFSGDSHSTPVNDIVVEPGLGAPAPKAAAPAESKPSAPAADALFADFDFSEPELASSKPALASDDADAFADIQFEFDDTPATKPSADVPMGLDDFLQQHQQKAVEQPAARRQPLADTVELPVPASVPTQTRKPAIDVESLMSGLSLELSPLDDADGDAAAPAAAPAPAASSAASNSLTSDFDDILNSLSLAPIDEPTPAAAATAAPRAAAPVLTSGLALELEPVEVAEEMPGFADAGDNPFSELEFGLDDAPAAAAAPASFGEGPEISGDFARIWVLGASIGGPDAVREFLAGIPRNTRNLFLLAQHMGADFLDLMVSQLAKATPLEVKMATSGSQARAGQVLVVPLAERLLIGTDGAVSVVPLDEATPYSPSIDQVLFDSADRFGARAGTIIFSGMAHDAIEGAKYLAAKGGVVWAQDPATCVVSSMIDGAIEAGIVRYQGGPSDLARKFVAEMG